MSKNFEHLKAGDTVYIRNEYLGYQPVMVERVTRTQIICLGDRYRKSDGRRMGDSSRGYYSPRHFLHLDSEKVQAAIEKAKRVNHCRNLMVQVHTLVAVNARNFDDKKIEQMVAACRNFLAAIEVQELSEKMQLERRA